MSRWQKGISKPKAVLTAAIWVAMIVLALVKGVKTMPLWLWVALGVVGVGITLWAGFSRRGRNTWFEKTGPGATPHVG
ncbi:hypothetical protein [Amycolatopsis plumensis]|uniref:Uncharacterized protein n=1 Tax=Amycolatopsis plumensis TaxID=236508 RepID=A0ABV5U3A2_9PSEU